ncbi:hypothetical protein PMAC_002394 [Pneumocystis sp. 'macacae']|nr:hypothetical protein PMAC_002394 [Pneumocystis sp. 'macacae']
MFYRVLKDSLREKNKKNKDIYDQTSKYFFKDFSKENNSSSDKTMVNSLDFDLQDSCENLVDWEDIEIHQNDGSAKDSTGDLDIVLNTSKYLKFKKKTSNACFLKRNVRIQLHLLHLACLISHGFLRNKWINDKETQNILRNKFKDECPSLFARVQEYRQGFLTQQQSFDNFGKILLLILQWFKHKFEIITLGIGKGFCYSKEYGISLEDRIHLFEIINSVFEFRRIALFLKGSRDSGAQILTSLLRALGFNARLVFSLQPLGLNFNSGHGVYEEYCKSMTNSLNNELGNLKKVHVMNELDNISTKFKDNLLVNKAKLISEFSFPYPVFWTEVYDINANTWYSLECMVLNCAISFLDRSLFVPRGKMLIETKMNASYIVAFEVDGYAKDVTFKYVNDISKLNRIKFPVSQKDKYTSFEKLLNIFKRPFLTDIDFKENDDLRPKILFKKIGSITINEYRTHPDYVLERYLKRDEVVRPGAFPVHVFTIGKGDKLKEEKVFNRSDILLCKSVEYYYREGRQIKSGELPLKIVKPKSVTLRRRRENAFIASETNEVDIQPLYAEFQTELYIPPPVVNGFVPKNKYGNTDLFTDSMIPDGATHLPYTGIGKIAKRLGFDYSDAVTGFEFKSQRAIPVITGILVATENANTCFEAWIFDQQKKIEKDLKKRQKEVLSRWRKFLLGLEIRDHVEDLYGNGYDTDFKIISVKK